MFVLGETFSKAFYGFYEYPDTSSIKNIHVLQDSMKKLGGLVDSDKVPGV